MVASKFQIKRICKFCGKEFITYKVTTRYCSKSCNSKAYKLNARYKQGRHDHSCGLHLCV